MCVVCSLSSLIRISRVWFLNKQEIFTIFIKYGMSKHDADFVLERKCYCLQSCCS